MPKDEKKIRKRRKREYTWYVEPTSPLANLILSNMLDAEETCEQVLLQDNSTRNLWRCRKHDQIALLRKNKDVKEGRDFVVYCQEGNGKIKEVSFPAIKRKARRKKEAKREARERKQLTLF
ncbi:MAG: hypothetical protein QY304_01075 [Candidatus Paceibacterota bacterium]|nr:MAG: hypothetical protein QY304_01075 [Candidatus Paceibacterota bacterium]